MADEYVVRVRIGAGLDSRSFDSVFGDATKRAQKAAQEVAKATRTTERQSNRERVESARSAEKEIASAERALLAQQRSAMRQFNAEWKRDRQEAARITRQAAQAERDEIRRTQSAARAAQRERDRFAFRTSHRATRFLFPTPEGALGYGRRVGMDIARGVGMDWSLGAGLMRNRYNEEAAQRLSSQGFIPGQGRFEDRIQAGELRKAAQGIGSQYGIAEGDVLGAMTRFTDVTGDLRTAKDTIGQIALLASATGTNIEEAASAAADMSMQLGDVPNKAQRVADLLGVAAMGGKQGAVEIRDLARYVPRIAAAAPSFAGDTGTNITKMLAMTQTARQFGGAASAAQAATSVAAMVNTLKTPARVAQFKAHGVDVYNKQGQLRGIDEIIKQSIVASKGSPTEFKRMWANVQGARAVEGMRNLYLQAGGGAKGLSAIDAQFRKFTSGIDPNEQRRLAEANVSVQARRAQQFQIEMDKVAQNLQAELLPALTTLAPKVKELAEGFSGLITFTTNHLPSAITLAIVAAIARAGIESTFRQGIDRMLGASSPAQASWRSGFKTFGGGLMTASEVLGTFAIAAGSTHAALVALNEWIERKTGNAGEAVNTVDTSLNTALAGIEGRTDLDATGKAEAKAAAVRAAQKRLAWEKEQAGLDTFGMTRLGGILTMNAHTESVQGAFATQEGKYQGMAEGFEAEAAMRRRYSLGRAQPQGNTGPAVTNEGIAQAVIEGLRGTTLNTNVKNLSDVKLSLPAAGPSVDPNGRTPPPGNRAP